MEFIKEKLMTIYSKLLRNDPGADFFSCARLRTCPFIYTENVNLLIQAYLVFSDAALINFKNLIFQIFQHFILPSSTGLATNCTNKIFEI